VAPVNETDMVLLPQGLKALKEVAKQVGLDVRGAYLNLDSGFESAHNRKCTRLGGLLPTKEREEYRIKNCTIPSGSCLALYRDRLLLPVERVSRKSANARRAIMPRFALSPVWTSSPSI
jgi:hypothetical protein